MARKQINEPIILGIDDAGTPDGSEAAVLVWATVSTQEGWEFGLTVPLSGENAHVVTDVQIRPAWDPVIGRRVVPRGGVQAATLRSLPLMATLRAAFDYDARPGSIGWFTNKTYPEAPEIVGAATTRAKGGRPRHYQDGFYAQVALDWERHTRRGPGALGRFTAERQAADPNVEVTTIKNWITAATAAGFLEPARGSGPRFRRATPLARAVAQRVPDNDESEITS